MNFETLDSKLPADTEVKRLASLNSDDRSRELSRNMAQAFLELPEYSLLKEKMVKDSDTVKDTITKIINLFWDERSVQAMHIKQRINHIKSLSTDFDVSAREKTQLASSVSSLFEFSASVHDLISDIFQSKLFNIARQIEHKEEELERYKESLKDVPDSSLLKDMKNDLVNIYQEKERIISLEKLAKIIIDDWYQENSVK